MSKRIQERKSGEEPAEAKPRSTCLISRNLLNEKQPSSLGSDASHVPGFRVCVRKHQELVRNKDQHPATCSQERNEDNPRQGSCGKLQLGVEINLKGSSQTIGTLRTSSRTCDRNGVSVLRHSMRRPMY